MMKTYILSGIVIQNGFFPYSGDVELCRAEEIQGIDLAPDDFVITISVDYPAVYERAVEEACSAYGSTLLKIYFSDEFIVFAFSNKHGNNCIECWGEHLEDNGMEYVLCGREGSCSIDDYDIHMLYVDIFLQAMLSKAKSGTSDGSVYVFSLRSKKLSCHKIIKHERCKCRHTNEYSAISERLLADSGAIMDHSYRVRSDIDTDGIKEDLCDSMSGIIRNIYKDMNSTIIPLVVCEMMTSGGRIINGSYGRSMSFRGSERSAILEMLERYSVMWPKNGTEVVRGSYSELKDEAYDPEKFILPYHKGGNNKFSEYSHLLKFDWIKAWRVTDGKEVYIPAQIAYYDLDEVKQDVERFVYETSNGAALGGSLQEAAMYGLFEVIERDSFMNVWYNKSTLPLIDKDSINSDRLKRLINQAEKNYELRFYNSTSDNGIPSVICIGFTKDKNSLVSSYMAAGCHIDPEVAVESALVEVISSIPVYERGFIAKQVHADELLANPEIVSEMEDHVLLYSRPQLREQYDFLLRSSDVCSIEEMCRNTSDICSSNKLYEAFRFVCDAVLKDNEEILIVDCTNDIIKKYGLYAVKVIVPGMLPMTFGNQNKRVSVERLLQTAGLPGRVSCLREGELFNMFPHPFP